jgi:phage portal protein BeeE
MDVGLGLAYSKIDGRWLGTEFETDDLLRMDYGSLVKAEKDASGIKTINEQRRRLNLSPVTGGATVYLQHQDHSIQALARRDASENPFASGASGTTTNPALPPAEEVEEVDVEDSQKAMVDHLRESLGIIRNAA